MKSGKENILLASTLALHLLLDGAEKSTSINHAGNRRIVVRCTATLQ